MNFQIFASQKSALIWCAIHGTRIHAKMNFQIFANVKLLGIVAQHPVARLSCENELSDFRFAKICINLVRHP
jgi:hypothetical protein